jgi:hypothetical protein
VEEVEEGVEEEEVEEVEGEIYCKEMKPGYLNASRSTNSSGSYSGCSRSGQY